MNPIEALAAYEAELVKRRRELAAGCDLARRVEFAELQTAIEAAQRARADEEKR